MCLQDAPSGSTRHPFVHPEAGTGAVYNWQLEFIEEELFAEETRGWKVLSVVLWFDSIKLPRKKYTLGWGGEQVSFGFTFFNFLAVGTLTAFRTGGNATAPRNSGCNGNGCPTFLT